MTTTTALHLERCGAAAAPVNGSLAVIGGEDLEGTLHSVELWDPNAESWRAGGRLVTARSNATATPLADGSVLVVGGLDGALHPLRQIELGLDEWHAAGSLATARAGHTATLLGDGGVVIAGGYDARGKARTDVDVWRSGKVARLAPLHTARFDHTATLLGDGTVLVVGGYGVGSEGAGLASVELYEPSARSWHDVASLATPRSDHTATRLADGRVLVVGGKTDIMEPTASVEVFDPRTGAWSVAHALSTARWGHSAVLLGDGRVLIAGGTTVTCEARGCSRASVTSLEIWDPTRDAWSDAGQLAEEVDHPAMALIARRVIIAGGKAEAHQCRAAAEIWSP